MSEQPSFPVIGNVDAAKAAIAQEIGKVVQGYGPEEVALLVSRLQGQTAPAPDVRDLFEIVTDPADLPAAVFRGAPAREVAPYDVPYIEGREGVANLQSALYERLFESGGALLVLSRAGVGKTREVAELAKRLCYDEGWSVCVARGEGDARIDTPAAFPDELRSRRLLFVIDDLHRRVDAGIHGQAAYLSRLSAFLDFFVKNMAPGEMYVVATARAEPHYSVQLGFDPSIPLWGRFKIFDLPEFTLAALRSALLRLAQAAGVSLDDADTQKMVGNSDHTVKTILDNVTRAKRRNERLTTANWLPSQGRSWEVRFREAVSRWPSAETVYHTLHLLRQAGLPTRSTYVVGVGSAIRGANVTTAVNGLVDMGLLALRGELLDAFADEQLQDSLQNRGKGAPQLSDQWPVVVETTVAQTKQHPEWSQDLLSLAATLLTVGRYVDAELTATTAIACCGDGAAFVARGAARFGQLRLAEAEEDFGEAVKRGGYDAAGYFGRGLARARQQKWAAADEDFSRAMGLCQDNAVFYFGRGFARALQQKWVEAEEDFSKAIGLGQDNGAIYSGRGIARVLQRKWAEAEEDFSKAMRLGQDNGATYSGRGIARVAQQKWEGGEGDLNTAIEHGQDDAFVYFVRGAARVVQAKWAEAEEDLSNGIDRGRDEAADYYFRGAARGSQAKWVGSEQDLDKAIERGWDDATIYFARGLARNMRQRSAAAEDDFTRAIQRGQDNAAVYLARGVARVQQAKSDGAEEDFSKAIERGWDDATVYLARGIARATQQKWAAAEGDYSKAIELGHNDPDVYRRRGNVRGLLQNWAGAEEDYSRAIERGQNHAEAYYQRGIARGAQEKRTDAEEDYSKAIQLGRNDADVYLKRGANRAVQGQWLGAEEDLSRAIDHGQGDADLYLTRAFLRVRLGRITEAQADCERAEKLNPGKLSTHPFRGYLHLALRQYDAAISCYEAARPCQYLELGLALLLGGRFPEAEAAYDKGQSQASGTDIKAALAEIDFWSVHDKEHLDSSEARVAVAKIRQHLEEACKTDKTGG